MQLAFSFFSLFKNQPHAINCKEVNLQMNAISVKNITAGLIQDIGASRSGREERKDYNLVAIFNIFYLDAKATALSRLKLNYHSLNKSQKSILPAKKTSEVLVWHSWVGKLESTANLELSDNAVCKSSAFLPFNFSCTVFGLLFINVGPYLWPSPLKGPSQ